MKIVSTEDLREIDFFILKLLISAPKNSPVLPEPSEGIVDLRCHFRLFPDGMRWSEIRDVVAASKRQLWSHRRYGIGTVGTFVLRALDRLKKLGYVKKRVLSHKQAYYDINPEKVEEVEKLLGTYMVCWAPSFEAWVKMIKPMLWEEYQAEYGIDEST